MPVSFESLRGSSLLFHKPTAFNLKKHGPESLKEQIRPICSLIHPAFHHPLDYLSLAINYEIIPVRKAFLKTLIQRNSAFQIVMEKRLFPALCW